jgi:hypothetical protein
MTQQWLCQTSCLYCLQIDQSLINHTQKSDVFSKLQQAPQCLFFFSACTYVRLQGEGTLTGIDSNHVTNEPVLALSLLHPLLPSCLSRCRIDTSRLRFHYCCWNNESLSNLERFSYSITATC